MTLARKLEYMRRLEARNKKGELPTGEFDRALYRAIRRADEEAMGLKGAKLGKPVSITKVKNVEVTGEVEGHTYWGNRKIMDRVCRVIR